MTILQNFVKLAFLEVAFLKIGFFGILVCNLQPSQAMSNFMVICPVVSEILGGDGTTPLDAIKKEQMLLNVNKT